jgi:carboxyl-terminal processing protease
MRYFSVTFLKKILFAVLPFMLMMASCEDELVGIEKANTPTNNFDDFWKTFDRHYGLFHAKGIDWNEVYTQFRPQVSDQMSPAELYNVLKDMIVLLNDNHINLYPTNGVLPVFPGGLLRVQNGKVSILKVQEDYSEDVIRNYVSHLTSATPSLKYGRLQNNIGYLNISGTDSYKSVQKNMEKILNELGETRALIIDIRHHYGGMDAVSQYIAGCFTAERKLYMSTRKRNGPKHDDFTPATEWYVSPTGAEQYTRPIILLTSRFTQSAGETFALAMRELSHVTLVGDTTAGSLSDNPNFEMGNGWIFSVSVGDYRDSFGKSYEGVGLPPEKWITTTRDDLMAGKDVALEEAIDILSK